MRNNTLITKEYTITCLSPVHIGSGDILYPYEYLYDRKSQILYFINESKWIAFLNQKKLMPAYSKFVRDIASKKDADKNVWEWLLSKNCKPEEIWPVAIRKAQAHPAVVGTAGRSSLNQITECIAMADGRPYIPGSSLKGAFRTAILAHILKNDRGLREKYWNRVKSIDTNTKFDYNDRNIKSQYGKLAKEMENQIFGELTKSKMRGLVVGDAVCDSKIDTIILKREFISTDKFVDKAKIKPLSMYWELIPADTKLNFQMTIDTAMLKSLGIGHPDDIVKMMTEFVQDGLSIRKRVFGKACPKEFKMADMADIILGGGTGLITKTLLYTLAPNEEAGREVVRNYLDKSFRKAAHRVADKVISPRTLHMVRDKKGYNIIGLCSIEDASC